METIIAQLHDLADWNLFIAPPLLAFSDGVILSHRADGVLIIIRAGKTHRSDALRAKQILERVNVRQIGVAMLNAPIQQDTLRYLKVKK